ncbi:5974_t:CDS:2 [Racocetra fulgida]|uniref:5974_t:CDS:1 n=1 Tax=Racocetra fulgida TaxID=60492 RepID=A0A9N8WKN2_9GLOM|nr:5974_t:CDS:2 [Racocetra fulgida]
MSITFVYQNLDIRSTTTCALSASKNVMQMQRTAKVVSYISEKPAILPAASTHQLTSTTATNEHQGSISQNSTSVEILQTNSLESGASAPTPAATQENIQARPIQTNQSRCFKCRAKIPLAKQTINKCRCEYVYCDNHKIPDKHDCDFDFAKMGKDILAKNNPKLNEVHKGGRSFNRID